MGIETYKYQWLRNYITILIQLLFELGNVCNSKSCPRITGRPDLEFLYVAYGSKTGKQCFSVEYYILNLETIQNILTVSSFFWNRSKLREKYTSLSSKVKKHLQNDCTHTYYSYKDIFIKYEEKYHLNERYTLFCKKFKILDKKYFIIK
jgi:hypothetical protein